MVFEGVLVDVLNHFLRPYLKNLDASQLRVGIWSGDVLLENLELKENALDDLNLPVRVFRGYLERLKFKIPWKNLYSAPIVAEIDGLYVITGPATAFRYDAEKSEKEKKERKEKQLKRIEEARKKAAEPKDDKTSQDPGFVEKLVASMIKNIQITVKNIHICYEDAVTNAQHPFSFGITLDSLFVQSTDCDYVVGGAAVDPDPAAMLIYKLLQVNCLAVYWQNNDKLLGTSPPDDWMELLKQDIARPHGDPVNTMQYVVHPITLESRLQLTTKPGRDMDIPQALVQVTLQQVSLALSRNQFQDMMGLVESLDRMSINVKFLKYRPVGVGVREGPEEWWRYAISAVTEEEVRRKLEMWSWKHIQQHRKWCRQYTDSYARKLLAKSITSQLQKELDFLEMKLDVFNITVCRQLAENKAELTRRAREEVASQAGGGGGGGGWWDWASGWVGGGGGEEGKGEEEKIHMPTEAELQEEKERMYEAIGYSENAEVPIYPKEYVAHRIALTLEEVSVLLWNENATVAHIQTLSMAALVQNRPSSKSITVQTTVGRLTARGLSHGTAGEGGEVPIILFSKHGEKESLLDLCVDVNPVDSAVSQRLKLQLLPVQITYHAATVDAAISMFMLSKDVQLQRLSAAAVSTLEELKTQGRAGLEHAISQRKLLDLDVVINSPCLVVPQNGIMSDSSCVLVADLGRLEIRSDLKSNVPDVREATDEELDEAFYDHFTLSLTRLQVLLAGPKQDWTAAWSLTSSPLHVLEPTSLELGLKKSLLPNDMRLPNMKVKGELPSLSLSISDQKVKQLLQLVQSLPLPPPSLAEKRMQSNSTYSIPDQPSRMGTDSIVGTISDTLLIGSHPERETESSEEFTTASECESDDDGILHHRSSHDTSRDEGGVVASTTQLSLQFAINKIGILFSQHHESSGRDTPRLHLMVTSMTSDLLVRSWDMQLTASVGNLHIADHYITGSDGEPGTFLSTQLMENQKFLTFSYSKFDPLAPHYVTEYKSTRQSVMVQVALLRLNVHSDSLLNLMEIGRSIATVVKTDDSSASVTAPELQSQDSLPLSSSSLSEDGGSSQQLVRGERELQARASLEGVEVLISGGDVGEVMSASVTGVESQVDMFQDHIQVMASMADIILLDNDPSARNKQIIHRMDETKKIVSLKVTVFKSSTPRDLHDLSTCDLDIVADVERLRVMVIFRFLGRVQRFATRFLRRLHLDQTTIDSAREAASNTASRTAEALKEQSSSRVKLNVIVRAPLLIIPYTPTPASASSPLSPPLSPPTPPSQRAFVANLGELTVKNDFKLASDVVRADSSQRGKGKNASLFLSPSGIPAVVDCMTVTISSVQLGRVLDMEKAGIGKSVSGDIHAKSHDVSADSHALLWPLQFKGQITRRLCDWCKTVPAISVACKLESIQMQFSPLDYHDMMCILQDVKEMESGPIDEESSSDLVVGSSSEVKIDCDKRGIIEEGEKEEQQEEGRPEDVSLYVEAVVGSVGVVLYSHVGGVAEINVKGVGVTVSMLNHLVEVQAKISGIEVIDCTPEVIYRKIVSVEEGQSAVSAQVTYFSDATKGEGCYDTSKSDLAVHLRVNRIRIVALYLFVARILDYVQQLHASDTAGASSRNDLLVESSQHLQPEPTHSDHPMRMKLDISVRAPEVTVSLSSLSCDIVVLDLGQLTLVNEFLLLNVGFSKDKSVALYEQYDIKLTELQIFRSVWDQVGNKPTTCQRGLLEPVTLRVEMQRNLSAQWFHGIPTISIDAKLEPLQVVASVDDIESLCLVLNANLKETHSGSERNKSAETLNEESAKHNRLDVHTEETRDGEESKQPFTEFLGSATLKGIILKLYYRDRALTCQDVSTWNREGKQEFMSFELENLQVSVKKESSGTVSANLSLENCVLDDLRATLEEKEEGEGEEDDGSTRETSVDAIQMPEKQLNEPRIRRMIQKRESKDSVTTPLISLECNLSQDNDMRLAATVEGIQVLANVKFIEAVVSFVRESTKPLTEGTVIDGEEQEEDERGGERGHALHHEASKASGMEGGKESTISITAEVIRPLIALLEDARQMNSAALVCQMEVRADISRRLPSNQTSVHSSVSSLTLSTARYPHLDKNIFKPVLGPLSDDVLAYMDQWDGTTKISVTLPSLYVILSPPTVRLVLNTVQSLTVSHSGEDEVGETAPANLWCSKTIARGPLRRKWFLREIADHTSPTMSHISMLTSGVSSVGSQLWNESLEVEIANITVVIEQEVTTPTLRTFPAITLTMGKYSSMALFARIQDWSSKMKATMDLYLEASYYNIRTDSWEPILEPVVDPRNESQYVSWGVKTKVVRSLPDHTRHHAKAAEKAGEDYEEEEEEEESAALKVEVCADSALQLTVTKSSLGIFTELVKAYTEKRVMVVETVDTPETYDAAFTIVNRLGKNYPVTVKPTSTLKVHGAYSPVLRQGDSPLPLHPVEGVARMKPGELLPRDSHLSRVHIVQLQIASFAPLEVALGMYERVYYPLTSDPARATGDKAGKRAGIVVDIDRTAGTPLVTLRSPLLVYNHLDQVVMVYHSLSHSPPLPGSASITTTVPADSTVPLPLSAIGLGFLFFQLPHTGLSQPAMSWESESGLDIACALTRTSRETGTRDKKSVSFIHTELEEEEYSRQPTFSLTERAHHIVHLHHPLTIHNLLPYSISLGEEGYSMVLIGSGCQANINYTKLSHTQKFLVEVEKKDKRWSGSFRMSSKSDEETSFTVTTHDSSTLELVVKKEEKGSWQLSVFSSNWIVNKTGLTLQYRAPEGFFNFGQRSTDVYTHNPDSAISLYPDKEVCVRVVKGGRHSEWSAKFSLEALGSEGIFSCLFKDTSEEMQIGTKVELLRFGTTRTLTLSPFYMVNNTTRDTVSFRECGQKNTRIYTVKPRELLPFWPCAGSECLEVSVGDDDVMMTRHSAPFRFTETRSFLVRSGRGQQLPVPPSPASSQSPQVPALAVDVQVTGSANIVTFTPYYPGCVPVQLVNHTEHPIKFRQTNGPQYYELGASESLMYTWDLPLGLRQLELSTRKLNKLAPQEDGSGYFFMPKDSASSDARSMVVKGDGSEAEDTQGDITEEVEEGEGEEGEGEDEEEDEGEEDAVRSEEMPEDRDREDEGKLTVQGTDETDFWLADKIRNISSHVRRNVGALGRTVTRRKRGKKRGRKVYWISFMDGLQRVLLFTGSAELRKRVDRGREREPSHTELCLSLIGTGLSLVDDIRGQEVAYIGIPQSQKEWQIRVKKLWKPVPREVSERLEQLYDPTQKSKGRKPLPDSDYEVDFNRMYLYEIGKGTKNKLRRSHLEGVYAQVTLSEHLTSVSIRISHVQIDNQLPLALHPIIIYPHPPPPSVANSCTPKPFIEGTVIIHKTEQSNINQIQYLQVLIQEIGVNLDMSFLMAFLNLFSHIPSSATEAQIVRKEVEYAKLPLKESKVVAVSAAVSRNYFKFLHLSPLIIHLSFSLEMSARDSREAKKATERNAALSMILNLLLSFAAIIGKTKDAELKLRYFEIEDESLTQQALVDRISRHYMQEGVIQMYSVVLGLEVLGNPVGFVKGLKAGTVGLFYHPIQGAVLGPEEFLEGVKLGGRQFVGGTVGGISGVLGKVTGVLGDTAANLTLDEEFVSQRKRTRGTVGQSLEGAALGVFEGVTGVISQPIRGAKKEGILGLLKGTGKGVLGLVLRPTGGLIDLTSATFNAVQRKTRVGDFDVTQLRPPRFIGQPKFVAPYSPHKAEGYALFLAVDNGRLKHEGDVYFDHVELIENPLKVLLITNNRFAVIKRNALFDRFEEDWKVMLSDMCGKTEANRNKVVIPVLEEQGWFLSSKKKKLQQGVKYLEVATPAIATKIVKLVNQAYQEYCATQTKIHKIAP